LQRFAICYWGGSLCTADLNLIENFELRKMNKVKYLWSWEQRWQKQRLADEASYSRNPWQWPKTLTKPQDYRKCIVYRPLWSWMLQREGRILMRKQPCLLRGLYSAMTLTVDHNGDITKANSLEGTTKWWAEPIDPKGISPSTSKEFFSTPKISFFPKMPLSLFYFYLD